MDLTAHVCTDLLRHWAGEAGWTWCGEVSQGQGVLALCLAQQLRRLGETDGSPFGPAAHPAGGVAATGGSRWTWWDFAGCYFVGAAQRHRLGIYWCWQNHLKVGESSQARDMAARPTNWRSIDDY